MPTLRSEADALAATAAFVLIACAFFVGAPRATAQSSGYCTNRSAYEARYGTWTWTVAERPGAITGSYHPCDVETHVRISALETCVELAAVLKTQNEELQLVPPGTPLYLMRLRCQQWSQSTRFHVYFRATADGPFTEIIF